MLFNDKKISAKKIEAPEFTMAFPNANPKAISKINSKSKPLRISLSGTILMKMAINKTTARLVSREMEVSADKNTALIKAVNNT